MTNTVAEVNKRLDTMEKANSEALTSIGEQIEALKGAADTAAFQEAVTKLQLDIDAVKDGLEALSAKIGELPSAGAEAPAAEFIERIGRLERQLGMK